MTTEQEEVSQPKRRVLRLGCLGWIVGVILLIVAVVVAIGTIFNQGDKAKQPVNGFEAGPADAYQLGSVNYIESEHLFVVRMPDGSFLALYDRSSRQQELNGDCRIQYDENAGIGTLEPLPGMTGAFVEACEQSRAVWRDDGTFSFGNGYGDMDRFATSVTPAGDLIIDESTRTCTRSKGVIGLPPFEERTDCGNPG